jgi:hypothetical protein
MDYKEKLLFECSNYLVSGAQPKMALQHMDDTYKGLYHTINTPNISKQAYAEESAKLSKAYGDIIIDITILLKAYIAKGD